MGDSYQVIVDRDASVDQSEHFGSIVLDWLIAERIVEPEASDCALGLGHRPGPGHLKATAEAPRWFMGQATNGMRIVTGRTVFNGWLDSELRCKQCGAVNSIDGLHDAGENWYEGGQGLLACSTCRFGEAITEWQILPPWGFGNLGFQFWNWPWLRDSFVEDISRLLGHRTVLVPGWI
jgi:hypothetical protein